LNSDTALIRANNGRGAGYWLFAEEVSDKDACKTLLLQHLQLMPASLTLLRDNSKTPEL